MEDHTRIYKKRRGPRRNIEKSWSRKSRTFYARLRTEHAKELKSYRHRMLETEDTATCELCGLEDETTMHILCRCPAHEKVRREEFPDERITKEMLVERPEKCRRVLEDRFPDLMD